MKSLLSFFFVIIIISQTGFSQTDASKIVLGIPTLGKSSTITDAFSDELSGAVQDQAGKVKNLKLVPRNNDAMKAIAVELAKTNDPTSLNADVLAAADKQSGATYLLVGTISKIDLTKTFVKYQKVLGVQVPVYAKFVNIQTSVAMLDVSTGISDTTAQISSDMVPIAAVGGDSRTYSAAFKLLAIKFHDFIQAWYNKKLGVTDTKK